MAQISPRLCCALVALWSLLCVPLARAQLQYELRLGDGGNRSQRTVNIGDTITLQVVAKVSGSDATANEGFQYGFGSIVSNAGTLKGTLGNFTLNNATGSAFNAASSSTGTRVDLNGDGILDIGSNATSQNSNFIFARASSMQTGGTRVGNTTEFVLGTVSFTVDDSTLNALTTSTSFNWVVPNFTPILEREALFRSDGLAKNDINGTITASPTGVTFSTGATEVYWKGGQSGNWSTDNLGQTNFTTDAAGSNVSGTLPGLATHVIFHATGATNLNTTLGRDFSIRKLTFASSATSPVTISGNTLTVNAGGITVEAGSGSHTINSNVKMGAAQTWTVAATAGPLTVNGVVSGAQAFQKAGGGTVVLGGTAPNTFTGATIIQEGTVKAAKTGALGATSDVKIQQGGTLLLGDTGSTAGRVRSGAGVELAGGTLASERAANASGTITENLGALTLTADSVIDLGALGGKSGNSSLTFSGTNSGVWTSKLTIVNWQGNYDGTTSTAGTSDHLFFLDPTNLLAGQLDQIRFWNGTSFYTATVVGNELVAYQAIPEPETVAAAILLLSLVGWRERRRVGGWVRRARGAAAATPATL